MNKKGLLQRKKGYTMKVKDVRRWKSDDWKTMKKENMCLKTRERQCMSDSEP